MIGFNNLGRSGRIGNQMFQYASLRGIANKHSYDWTIPPQGSSSISPDGNDCNYLLWETFKLKSAKNTGFVANNTLQERQFHFDEDLFNSCPDDCSLNGCFQTEKYFKHIENDIREDFTFHEEILEPCKEFIDSIGSDRIVFLHVRRGHPKLRDAYTNLEHYHPLCSIDYYKNAIEQFPNDVPILVFSDYIEWCKDQDLFKDDRFMLSEQYDEFSNGIRVHFSDLCLMSLCTDAIIANSSFSWWGAWLQKNPNKKIVAPKTWFGPGHVSNNTKDLIPEDRNWIRL